MWPEGGLNAVALVHPQVNCKGRACLSILHTQQEVQVTQQILPAKPGGGHRAILRLALLLFIHFFSM